MLLASFPAGPLAANCYLVATDSGRECVIVDPGMESLDRITEIVTVNELDPVAVLLTHGHVDHAASAALVADRYHAGCWVGPGDRRQLTDPLSGLPEAMHAVFAGLLAEPGADGLPGRRSEPARMLDLQPGRHRLAGLELEFRPAPGHTPGSTLFVLDLRDAGDGAPADVSSVVFTGDVIFAGSIGRTDLPGGDHQVMLETLRSVVLSLPDDAVLLPGHGPQTTVARERATNSFLAPLLE